MGSCQSMPVTSPSKGSLPTTKEVDPLWEGKFELAIRIDGNWVSLVVKPTDTVQSVREKLSAFSGWSDESRLYCNEKGIVLEEKEKTLQKYGITNECHGLCVTY